MDGFIAEHLKGVSRTYALLIPMLPASLSEAVGLAYLLMRIVDTLEDDQRISDEQRERLLRHFDRLLQLGTTNETAIAREIEQLPQYPSWATLGDSDSERALMGVANVVLLRIRTLEPVKANAVHECARKMIAGVLSMLARGRALGQPYPAIRASADLREYCYYVAGVVGEMLCTLMADYLRQPALLRLRPLAVELGIGLQLVNILKDAVKDARQGRRYLPTSESGEIGVSQIYKMVVREARTSLLAGVEFVMALPAAARELRFFCGLPIAWGAMTLARAERDAGKGKISRGAIRSSIELFGKLSLNDQALRKWFDNILAAPAPSRG